MARRLIWIDEKELSGWGCADCGWNLSNQSDLPVGQELRMQFADHNCEEYPRLPRTKTTISAALPAC